MTDADNRPAVVGQVERPVRPDPERAAFEAWAAKRWGREAHRHTSATSGEWEAWKAATARERHRCALICDTTPPYPFRASIEAAHAIRKGQP